MKYIFRFPIISPSLLLILLLTSTQCKKSPALSEFYFRCNVDGQEYRPNGCANSRVARLLGDTTFLFNGNKGFESILIGVIKLDHLPIS